MSAPRLEALRALWHRRRRALLLGVLVLSAAGVCVPGQRTGFGEKHASIQNRDVAERSGRVETAQQGGSGFAPGRSTLTSAHDDDARRLAPAATPAPETAAAAAATAIPFAEIGAKATKDYQGDAMGITPTREGAQLRTGFQKLAGTVTSEGLWLESTEAEGGRLRVIARSVGRGSAGTALPASGSVTVAKKSVLFARLGLTEEYSVSVDGVRQDFIIADRPTGTGALQVRLALSGARAEAAADGARLILTGSGRTLAYNRLNVTDATGKQLSARIEVPASDSLAIRVEDAGAVYPVRIDPTFSDADWVSLNPGVPGADFPVLASIIDGAGNLYIGGSFALTGVAANRIAKWDGSSWSALGTGMSGTNSAVNALAIDGSGNLYAGGAFTKAGGVSANNIAKWNGNVWTALDSGLDNSVKALAVNGADLYVGGSFVVAGGITVNRIAKWNGSVWSALGAGITTGSVNALAVNGSNLYAGGSFTAAGGVTAANVAAWDGNGWTALGSGTDNTVNALAVSGSDLYVGGNFTTAGGAANTQYIAKWNGSGWSALGSGTNNTVNALIVAGDDLLVGGVFRTAGGVSASGIAKWSGGTWSALGAGLNYAVYTLAVDGSNLFAGGSFWYSDSSNAPPLYNIAKWNGVSWLGLGTTINSKVNALAVMGGDLYAGGEFTTASGQTVNYIARWNGSTWSSVGSGMNGLVYALAVIGTDLYAGGRFSFAGGTLVNNIAKWDGVAWSPLGAGTDGAVQALLVKDTAIYVGGRFGNAGGLVANNIAKWDGTNWSVLGSGVTGTARTVYALAMSGTDLYAGGWFDTAGGLAASNVAKWNGSTWAALGTGTSSYVYSLAASGSNLFVGGGFSDAGGVTVYSIAQWNGSTWLSVGGTTYTPTNVRSLVVIGSDLYAGGYNTGAGNLMKWNGTSWLALGSSTLKGGGNTINAMVADGSGHLFLGGDFNFAGATPSPFVVQANLNGGTLDLSALNLNAGSLIPAFSSATTTYTASVSNATTAITVTPSVTMGNANAKVNGVPVVSGASSGPINLVVGANLITIDVTGQDAVTTKTYKVTVTRTTVPTVVSPTSASITTTSATLGGNASSDGGASISMRGVVYAPTAINSSPQIGGAGVTNKTHTSGSGTFGVNVTGLTPGTSYTYAAYATNIEGTSYSATGTFSTLSTDATLSGLALSSGTLSPVFASGTLSYTATVSNATTSVMVTPITTQANASVKVNGTTVASGTASGPVSLVVGSNTLTIVVTAQDGTTTKTYTVAVSRTSLPSVTTPTSTSVSGVSATLGGWVTSTGFTTISARGVVYSPTGTNGAPQLGGTGVMTVAVAGGLGTFTAGVSGLTPNTPYTYAAYATNSEGTSYSSFGTFTTASLPTVTTPTSASLTGTSATLGGSVTSDGGATISARGVVCAPTATNGNPRIGGLGVANILGSGTTGVFTVNAIGLTPGTAYSYAAYATNDGGTSYSSTGTFTTLSNNPNLSGLVISTGTLSPSFASGTTSYTVTVADTLSSLTVTPTVAQANASVKVNGTAVNSGSASGAISLGYGANTITTVVTAQDGTTTKTYTIVVTRLAPNPLVATYSAATNVPLTTNGFTATGGAVSFSLNYAPLTGTNLMVVKNTGLGFINGAFSNLAQGQAVALTYNSVTYNFVANYYGGTGNDLVLQWAATSPMSWGWNATGQLGNNSTTNSLVPAVVNTSGVLSGRTTVAVAAGAFHSLALCGDGTLAAWGDDTYGQLGDNSTTQSNVPVAVNQTGALAGKTVVAVAAGQLHSLVLCSDGTMAAWGNNSLGQLGNNSSTDSPVPVAVSAAGALAGKTVVAIAAGSAHNLALCSDGSVVAWGYNGEGELGNNSTTTSLVPVAVSAAGVLVGRSVIAVAAGNYHSLVACADGTVHAWGGNSAGQLGNGSNTDSLVPVAVTMTGALNGKTVTAIASGSDHCVVQCSDASMATWGWNGEGELGNNSTTNSNVPITISPSGVLLGKTVSTISAGGLYTQLMCTDSTMVTWGWNGEGELGNNNTTTRKTPGLVTTTSLPSGGRFMLGRSGSLASHSLAIVGLPPTAPVATTLTASSPTMTGATLSGTVNANFNSVSVTFEYGTTAAYGSSVAAVPGTVGGSTDTNVGVTLTGLAANTTYHFRVTATNSSGTVTGGDATFTTLQDPPVAITTAPTAITNATAMLSATVNPNGRSTTVSFEYGLNTFYGSTTTAQVLTAGTSAVNVTVLITGLTAGATVHYRVIATNSGGTATGADVAFTTTTVGIATAPPTVSAVGAISITTTGARLQGNVNPNGGSTNAFFEYGIVPGFGSNSQSLGAGSGTQPQNVFFDVTGLQPGTPYQLRLVAQNNYDNGTPGANTTTGSTVTFTTNFLPPEVTTGGATALTTTSTRISGTVNANGTSTQVFFDYGTDGVNYPFSVNAAQGTIGGNTTTAVTADLTNLLQDVTYSYRVRAVSSGGTTTGATGTFQIAILSGLLQQFPSAAPAAQGALSVTLTPAGLTSAWRFVGETLWRTSGTTVVGLTTGSRDIEFLPVPGYINPPQETVSTVSGDPTLTLTRVYYTTTTSGSGSLMVTLKPDELAASTVPQATRAQWRFLGEDDSHWRDSNVTVTGLNAGSYSIECKPVSGRATPTPVKAVVSAGTSAISTITYFLPDSLVGTGPSVLPFANVSTDQTKPYAYVGQIRSTAGVSTGFVVKARVVATAGHVVWDDGTLSAAQGLQWLFQHDAGSYEPTPQIPRGFYTFDGYAAQRTLENTPGTSSPLSQTLDVAAMYFLEDAGRGGYGGWLASDNSQNEFLLSNAQKMLVGYPVDGITGANQGRMFATPAANVSLTAAYGRTFTTSDIHSFGGNSGGPLCVQYQGGAWYPAAIYLGGTNQTVVRSIDSAVIDLFNRAETSGAGGGNNTGGGITHTSVTTFGTTSNPGALSVIIQPAGAVSAGAGWRLSPETSYRVSGAQKSGLNGGSYVLQLNTVAGYDAPASQNVTVTGGQLSTVTFTYAAALSAQESWRMTYFGISTGTGSAADGADPDGDGMSNLAEYTAGTNPTSATDVFKVQSGVKNGGSFTLTAAGKNGRTYVLERSLTMAAGTWTAVATQGPLSGDGSVTLTDAAAPAGAGFYRIRVTGP